MFDTLRYFWGKIKRNEAALMILGMLLGVFFGSFVGFMVYLIE